MTPQEYSLAIRLSNLADVHGFWIEQDDACLIIRPSEALRKRLGYSGTAKFRANTVEQALGFIEGFSQADFAHTHGKTP